jgi:transcriptional regulator with XRE-family HTH domain
MTRRLEDLIADERPEIVEAAQAKADAMLFDLRLAQLREQANLTQEKIAQMMQVMQPTVAGFEKSGQDLRLSSLKRYVEAIGGRVRLDIELPDGSHHGFPIGVTSLGRRADQVDDRPTADTSDSE